MSKLSKRQRAQVVELLRCAADQRADGIGLNGMYDAHQFVCFKSDVPDHRAWDALLAVARETNARNRPRRVVGVVDELYRAELLEAAQRVEEETWP